MGVGMLIQIATYFWIMVFGLFVSTGNCGGEGIKL
jgi:hypothetical protein